MLARGIQWLGLGAIALFVAVNLFMVGVQVSLILVGSDAVDWNIYVTATERFAVGNALRFGSRTGTHGATRPSPCFHSCSWLHSARRVGACSWVCPSWPCRAVPGSWPLPRIPSGSRSLPAVLMILVVVAAFWALRGNRWAIGVFLVLALLVPRPLMLPIAGWVLWKHPRWRWPFVGLFVIARPRGRGDRVRHDEWLDRLAITGGEEIVTSVNVAPSAFIGLWWLVISIPLAIWAFAAARPAMAGLLLQPYWLPYYLLILLADALPPRSWWLARLTPFGPTAGAAAAEPPAAAPG